MANARKGEQFSLVAAINELLWFIENFVASEALKKQSERYLNHILSLNADPKEKAEMLYIYQSSLIHSHKLLCHIAQQSERHDAARQELQDANRINKVLFYAALIISSHFFVHIAPVVAIGLFAFGLFKLGKLAVDSLSNKPNDPPKLENRAAVRIA